MIPGYLKKKKNEPSSPCRILQPKNIVCKLKILVAEFTLISELVAWKIKNISKNGEKKIMGKS